MEESENIRKLKNLTKSLPSLGDLVTQKDKRGNIVRYDGGDGICIGRGLLKREMIAVQQTIISSGTKMECHKHRIPIVEIIHVYKGSIKFMTGGKAVIIKAGETITIKAGQGHKCVALQDSETVGVTMPAEKSYPNDR